MAAITVISLLRTLRRQKGGLNEIYSCAAMRARLITFERPHALLPNAT